jgi:hypothetical protein
MWHDIAKGLSKIACIFKEQITILTRSLNNKVALALHAAITKAKDGFLQRVCSINRELFCLGLITSGSEKLLYHRARETVSTGVSCTVRPFSLMKRVLS